MPICYSRLPSRFEDGRHNAIHLGFKNAGFAVTLERPPGTPGPDDVLVTWNTYGDAETIKKRFRRHVVAEEAYIRRIHGEKYFALGLNGHNGNGQNPIGDELRWNRWGITPRPWRRDGNHVLVCGQRGFGYNEMAMPDHWPDQVYAKLRGLTDRPLWFRPHPKRRRRMPLVQYDRVLDFNEPIADQLMNCWACVVYTSNAATDALLAGVPAFYCGPNLITRGASIEGLSGIELACYPERSDAFRRLSWSQFSMEEIRSGWAIRQIFGKS